MIALVTSVAIAACGGSSGSPSSAASTTQAGLKFAACVRAHGVPDFPDPSSNNSGGLVRATPGKMSVDGHTLSESPRVVQKAMQKCQKYSPAAKGPPISAAQLAKIKAGALAMAKCMRAHGVPNFPDPQVGTGPGGHGVSVGIRLGGPPGSKGSGANGTLDPRSPAFQAAQKRCQPLMSKVMPGLPGKKG
jgi:hypothetical protein